MDDRAEFEQWASTAYEDSLSFIWCTEAADYMESQTAIRWESWQAATGRQRERDAQIADELYINHIYTERTVVRYRDDVAEAIRRQP